MPSLQTSSTAFEIDLMGSYSSSYRLQSLATDIVFNQRIDVEALICDRDP